MRTKIEVNKNSNYKSRFRCTANFKAMKPNEWGVYSTELIAHGSTEQQAVLNLKNVIKSAIIDLEDELMEINKELQNENSSADCIYEQK